MCRFTAGVASPRITLLDALNIIAPNLEAIVYPGGTRGYGIYLPGGTFAPPLNQSMTDNLPIEVEKLSHIPTFDAFSPKQARTGNGRGPKYVQMLLLASRPMVRHFHWPCSGRNVYRCTQQ
jgi:hypothetical protein